MAVPDPQQIDTTVLAQVVLIELRTAGHAVPAGATTQLAFYADEAFSIMEEVAGYKPHSFAAALAQTAARQYMKYRYLDAPTLRNDWDAARVRWGRAAAKAYKRWEVADANS